MDIEGSACLVTGATSGIGWATALRLLGPEVNAKVIALGRDAGALDGLAVAARQEGYPEDRLVGIRADLSDPADVDPAVQEALSAFGHVDVLVNNAGLGWARPFAEQEPESADYLVQVNLIAAIRLTRAVIPGMLERRSGAIVNVASITGHVGVKHEAVYGSTKAGLVGFSESLRYELEGSGVQVSVVSPGAVQTSFFERRGRPYGRSFPRPITPERVADTVVRAIRSGRPQLYAPRWMAFPVWLRGTWPGLYRMLAGRFG